MIGLLNWNVSDLHVSGVTHTTVTGLWGSFVLTSLKAYLGVAALAHILFCEVALIFSGHFGSQPRSLVLGMILGLAGQGIEAQGHLEKQILIYDIHKFGLGSTPLFPCYGWIVLKNCSENKQW